MYYGMLQSVHTGLNLLAYCLQTQFCTSVKPAADVGNQREDD